MLTGGVFPRALKIVSHFGIVVLRRYFIDLTVASQFEPQPPILARNETPNCVMETRTGIGVSMW